MGFVGNVAGAIIGPSAGSRSTTVLPVTPPAFISASALTAVEGGYGSGTKNIARPAGTVEGDLVILIACYRNSIFSTTDFTTEMHRSVNPTSISVGLDQNDNAYVGWRVATGSEPANYSFSYTDSGSNGYCAQVMTVRGAGSISDLTIVSSGVCAAVTALEEDMLVSIFGTVYNTSTITGIAVPAGMTEVLIHKETAGDTGNGLCYQESLTAGSTGTKTWAVGGWTAYEFGINMIVTPPV